jgi:hypothetical protein
VAAVRQAITQVQPEVIALSIRNVDDQSMQETKFLLEPVRNVVAACRAASPAKLVVGGADYRGAAGEHRLARGHGRPHQLPLPWAE